MSVAVVLYSKASTFRKCRARLCILVLSVSIASHSVTLNKATDVGCFTVWGVAQIGVAYIVGVAHN